VPFIHQSVSCGIRRESAIRRSLLQQGVRLRVANEILRRGQPQWPGGKHLLDAANRVEAGRWQIDRPINRDSRPVHDPCIGGAFGNRREAAGHHAAKLAAGENDDKGGVRDAKKKPQVFGAITGQDFQRNRVHRFVFSMLNIKSLMKFFVLPNGASCHPVCRRGSHSFIRHLLVDTLGLVPALVAAMLDWLGWFNRLSDAAGSIGEDFA
jgi:hypothetical protein